MTSRSNDEQERACELFADVNEVSEHKAVARANPDTAARQTRDELSAKGRSQYATLLARLAR